jgi:hypothetical protein
MPADASATLLPGEEDYLDESAAGEPFPTDVDAVTTDLDSALPAEPDSEVAGDLSPEATTDSERSEASDDEMHDVALAAETSTYSPHGHEVTSQPSDDDQGETIRIVREAIEQSELGHPAGTSASTPEPSSPPRSGGTSSTSSRSKRRSGNVEDRAPEGS